MWSTEGMKNDFGGHDNHHYDTIYAYAGRALGVTSTLAGYAPILRSLFYF